MLSISVIIANWKRQKFIPSIIEQLSGQNYPKDKYEVIIVDDNTPNPEEVYAIVREQKQKHSDIPFRLFETHKNITNNPVLRYNVGARNAKGEVLLFNESDVLMQGEFLQQASAHHERDLHLWLGPEVVLVDAQGKGEIDKARWVCDLGASIRKENYYAVRGFDERTRGWGGIESELWDRLRTIGVHYEKDPAMTVLHRAVELCGLDPNVFMVDAAPCMHLKLDWIGNAPNLDSWGTVDSLEEVHLT